ncbi:hypothetical protein HZA43_04820 [Candidatus Peregrinibacteria bacterium]|nr:hypothetical protein [Candidatus Peregrinibacteria bacterium]
MTKKQLGFVADPETLDEQDTFFLFVNEALRRPHLALYVFDIGDVDWKRKASRVHAITRSVSHGARRTLLTKKQWMPLKNFDGLFLKKDPPLNAEFIRFLKFLKKERIHAVNDPEGILAMGTKAYLSHFKRIIPETFFTHDVESARAAIIHLKDAVLKQSDSYGGRAVMRVSCERNTFYDYHGSAKRRRTQKQIDQKIQHFLKSSRDRTLLIVRYLPGAPVRGDKRVVVLDGTILGSYIRLPDPKSGVCVCANQGARQSDPTARDQEIVQTIAPHLKKHGIALAALDLLADEQGVERLSEINVVNPGFCNLHVVHPEYDVAKQVIDMIERRLG